MLRLIIFYKINSFEAYSLELFYSDEYVLLIENALYSL